MSEENTQEKNLFIVNHYWQKMNQVPELEAKKNINMLLDNLVNLHNWEKNWEILLWECDDNAMTELAESHNNIIYVEKGSFDTFEKIVSTKNYKSIYVTGFHWSICVIDLILDKIFPLMATNKLKLKNQLYIVPDCSADLSYPSDISYKVDDPECNSAFYYINKWPYLRCTVSQILQEIELSKK